MEFQYKDRYEQILNKEIDKCLNHFKEKDSDKVSVDKLPYIIKFFKFPNEDEEIQNAEEGIILGSEKLYDISGLKEYLLPRLLQRDPFVYYKQLFNNYADPASKKIDLKKLTELFKKLKKKDKEKQIQKIFEAADFDQDGFISEEDFIKAVKLCFVK